MSVVQNGLFNHHTKKENETEMKKNETVDTTFEGSLARSEEETTKELQTAKKFLRDIAINLTIKELATCNFKADKQALQEANESTNRLIFKNFIQNLQYLRLSFLNVELSTEVILCDVLVELIRENEEVGFYEISERYKDLFFAILPIAEKQSGCNLRYFGINQ